MLSARPRKKSTYVYSAVFFIPKRLFMLESVLFSVFELVWGCCNLTRICCPNQIYYINGDVRAEFIFHSMNETLSARPRKKRTYVCSVVRFFFTFVTLFCVWFIFCEVYKLMMWWCESECLIIFLWNFVHFFLIGISWCYSIDNG